MRLRITHISHPFQLLSTYVKNTVEDDSNLFVVNSQALRFSRCILTT